MAKIGSWYIGVAAEAYCAGLFSRCEVNVSVQYGADQPEYDLAISKDDKMLKVSVKGSQDGAWGLTQSYLKDRNYHGAVDLWLARHSQKTIFCFVQFQNVGLLDHPRVYLATPGEIANHMKASACGRGDTVLYEEYTRGPRSSAPGYIERIPMAWCFSKDRLLALLSV
jgi:hypothetical protein